MTQISTEKYFMIAIKHFYVLLLFTSLSKSDMIRSDETEFESMDWYSITKDTKERKT